MLICPALNGAQPRVSSPFWGCSILITSAPKSASVMVHPRPCQNAAEIKHFKTIEWRLFRCVHARDP